MDDRLIGIDTNIVVRLLTRDDEEQFGAVVNLIGKTTEAAPLLVNPLVIAETVWVLESVYKAEPKSARSQLAGLLDTVQIKVPERLHLAGWPKWLKSWTADFADIAIADINRENGCDFTYTFDKRAAKAVPGMELLQ